MLFSVHLQELFLRLTHFQKLVWVYKLTNIQKLYMSQSQTQTTTQFTFNVTANSVKAKPR